MVTPIRRFAPLFLLALLPNARAEVKLNPLFSDGAVLQRDREIPVWGTAADGEKVTVDFLGQSATTTASNGTWKVRLQPISAGGPYEMKVHGENEITVKDLLVGEVWVCSGQSNMQFPLAGASTGQQEIPKADYPQIRLFQATRKTAVEPQTEIGGAWAACTPETAKGFSAVAYFFGRDVYKALNVPVGLIHSSWGGTPAQAWTSAEALGKEASLRGYVQEAKRNEAAYPAALAAYPAKLAAYEEKLRVWKEKNDPKPDAVPGEPKKRAAKPKNAPRPPRPPDAPEGSPRSATVLYNGMIAPLIPYAMRGVIWYQGEGNAGLAKQYRTLFPTMIADWRGRWQQGDFPFLYVQLAPFGKQPPEIREAQLLTLKTSPNTAMTITADIGDLKNIHPKRKEKVGERLALAARALAYGEKIEFSGPIYKDMRVEGDTVLIRFDHAAGGLKAEGGQLAGFTLAGPAGKFLPAQAEIRNGEVAVFADGVRSPAAVRYSWGTYDGNLYNAEGLPASPFRSDVD